MGRLRFWAALLAVVLVACACWQHLGVGTTDDDWRNSLAVVVTVEDKKKKKKSSFAARLNNNGDNKGWFDFVLFLHIPKAGGRTMQQQLSKWFSTTRSTTSSTTSTSSNDSGIINNCGIPGCCSLENYTHTVPAVWLNPACGALSLEIKYDEMVALQQVLFQPTTHHHHHHATTTTTTTTIRTQWYLATVVRSPLDRLIATIKHKMRKGQCNDNNNLQQSVQAILDDACAHVEWVQRRQVHYLMPGGGGRTGNQSITQQRQTTATRIQQPPSPLHNNPRLDHFHFVGLTHCMDVNFCLLALEFAHHGYHDRFLHNKNNTTTALVE